MTQTDEETKQNWQYSVKNGHFLVDVVKWWIGFVVQSNLDLRFGLNTNTNSKMYQINEQFAQTYNEWTVWWHPHTESEAKEKQNLKSDQIVTM